MTTTLDGGDDVDLDEADLGMDDQRNALVPCPAENTQSQDRHVSTLPGRTLLPASMAQAVSFATRSTSLALRVGMMVGSFGLGAAKVTTLSSLELGRGILEGILSRAGKDVIARSQGELGRADAESLLEKSLETLHRTMTQIVFWTTTGFHFTGTTMSVVTDMSQLLLNSLDQFFGSTDSSRAIASIITLIRREFQNPATGVQGERVGVVDLILGLCGLAYLQQWCGRLVEAENRRLRIEDVVWDVVVLNSGERVDVHEESFVDTSTAFSPEMSHNILGAAHNVVPDHPDDSQDLAQAELQLKRQIMASLPEGTSVSLTTSVSTTKTITVDISGPDIPSVSLPPGFELVEFEALPSKGTGFEKTEDGRSTMDVADGTKPTYRIVYRVKRRKETTTQLQRDDGHNRPPGLIELVDEEQDQLARQRVIDDSDGSTPPPLPPSRPGDVNEYPGKKPKSSSKTSPASSPNEKKRLRPSKHPSDTGANQKRLRIPASAASQPISPTPPSRAKETSLAAPAHAQSSAVKTVEKKGGFRKVLRKGPVPGITTLLRREESGPDAATKPTSTRPSGHRSSKQAESRSPILRQQLDVAVSSSLWTSGRDTPDASQMPLVDVETAGLHPRSASRSSYVAVHETKRDSLVSQTDTYSIHATDGSRPVSPTFKRTEVRSGGYMVKSKSDKELAGRLSQPQSPTKHHRRARSHAYTPSIYTLGANGSETSLVAYSYRHKSAYNDAEALDTLRRSGTVVGIFPKYHLLRNLDRYMRFASASYGSNFLKFMKIGKGMPVLRALEDTHYELRSFAHHTQSDTENILLSSFVDPQGGSDSTGSTNTGVPLVHYISLDHESKAVVLACRGTLGFEDVLADMTCDYDTLVWRGNTYQVHKGIHASARRLLYGGDGRVLLTLRQALEEFQDYGVVLTGHSLGGAVTALLGVMLSEPADTGASFVTSSSLQNHHQHLLTSSSTSAQDSPSPLISLPPGRPIHVYAYGPPATMSTSLRRATCGLITSVVHGNDIVPYLSLGVLHDLQAVALSFKTDNSDAKGEVRQRIWEAFQTGLANKWYAGREFVPGTEDDGEEWAWAALKVLRASMLSKKLVPPGEVFVVEGRDVLRRDAFVRGEEGDIGRPARRVVLKFVRDVEARFGEVRFGMGMLTDHSPGKYEDALRRLQWGVMECRK